jgi:hypothetical protein
MVNSKNTRPEMSRSSYRQDGPIALIDGSAAAAGTVGASAFGNSGAGSQDSGTTSSAAAVPFMSKLESILEVS